MKMMKTLLWSSAAALMLAACSDSDAEEAAPKEETETAAVEENVDSDVKESSSDAESEEETQSEEEVLAPEDYGIQPIELINQEEEILVNDDGSITFMGYGITEEVDPEDGETDIYSVIAVKVDGGLKDILANTDIPFRAIFEGGTEEQYNSWMEYHDQDSKILLYRMRLEDYINPLRIDYKLESPNYDEEIGDRILVDDEVSETVTVGGITKAISITTAAKTSNDELEMAITEILVDDDEITFKGNVTSLEEDQELESLASLSFLKSGDFYVDQFNRDIKVFAGIPTEFEASFDLKQTLLANDDLMEFYFLGMGIQLSLNDKEISKEKEKRLFDHISWRDYYSYFDVQSSDRTPSYTGTKDTNGNTYFTNTFAIDSHGGYSIPLGQQFDKLEATLTLQELVEETDKPIEPTVIHFFERDSFEQYGYGLSYGEPPIKVIELKAGEEPVELSLDVSDLNGLYIEVAPQSHDPEDDTHNPLSHKLLITDGYLHYK